MGATIDGILTIGALIIGIMMFIGKGDFFMNDKNSLERNKKYDNKKMQRGFGVALIVVGIATGISTLFTSTISYIIYIIVVILAIAGSVVYMRKYCKK